MITVLLATHNGSDTIDHTLEAMSRLEAPAGGWELIVVNNASTDATESLVLKWQDRLPLKYLIEPRLGKSKAINTGLAHAKGDFIVMTDDDVLPDRDWLSEWRRVADAWPGLDVFGGAIMPEYGDHPPRWPIPRVSLTLLYAQTPDLPESEIAPSDVSGPNMAARRPVFEKGLRFNEELLVGKNGMMGEDAEFVAIAAQRGCRIGFAPKARVRHIVHADQTRLGWILHRFYRIGRAHFLLLDMKTMGEQFVFPRWRVRRAISTALSLFPICLTFDRARIFDRLRELATDLGAVRQAWIVSRESKRPGTVK